MRVESSGKPDAWKLARPVWGWGRGAIPRPTPRAEREVNIVKSLAFGRSVDSTARLPRLGQGGRIWQQQQNLLLRRLKYGRGYRHHLPPTRPSRRDAPPDFCTKADPSLLSFNP